MKLATLCFIRDKGKTLMSYRTGGEEDIHNRKYSSQGGHIEEGESPEECNRREIGEETNLELIEPSLIGFCTFDNRQRTFNGKRKDNYCVFVYECFDTRGELKQNARNHYHEWFDTDKLYELPMHAGDYLLLEWIRQRNGRIFSGKIVHKEEKLDDIESRVIYY